MRHLSPEALLDVAEGTAAEDRYPHLADCATCRDQIAELQAAMTAVAVDVPEPSPLFWDHLSDRVSEAIAAEGAAPESGWTFRKMMWPLVAAATAAVVILAVSFSSRQSTDTGAVVDSVATAQPANVDSIVVDDPSLELLADLAGDLDWDAAAEAGMTMEVGAADEALSELTGAERIELQRLLREAMSGSGV